MEKINLDCASVMKVPKVTYSPYPKQMPVPQSSYRPFAIPVDCWAHTPPGADVEQDADAVLLRMQLNDLLSCSSEYPQVFNKMITKKRGSHMWVVGYSEKFC